MMGLFGAGRLFARKGACSVCQGRTAHLMRVG